MRNQSTAGYASQNTAHSLEKVNLSDITSHLLTNAPCREVFHKHASNLHWERLSTASPIDLQATLMSGQLFSFTDLKNGCFCGTYDGKPILVRQVPADVARGTAQHGLSVEFIPFDRTTESALRTLFNLDVSFKNLSNQLTRPSQVHSSESRTAVALESPGSELEVCGLRPLTGELFPVIFSFICSANNNIPRITQMVHNLYSLGARVEWPCLLQGCPRLAQPQAPSSHTGTGACSLPPLHTFPSLAVLAAAEPQLRLWKFGYRAKYIARTAQKLLDACAGDVNALHTRLRDMGYQQARAWLCQLPGVGLKVADCICLIGLRFFEAVPIDTHVRQYSNAFFGASVKSLSKRNYEALQMFWHDRYGAEAGVAQLLAFYQQRRQKK